MQVPSHASLGDHQEPEQGFTSKDSQQAERPTTRDCGALGEDH